MEKGSTKSYILVGLPEDSYMAFEIEELGY
jgi:hypothetical protein